MTTSPQPKTIQKLLNVYPSFALLAGMQLDVFTPLKDGPMCAEEIAEAIGVSVAKLKPLLYALVAAELLIVEDDRFANTAEANHFLVCDSPAYYGGECELYAKLWSAALQTAASIRTGRPQARHDYTEMPRSDLTSFLRGLHPDAVATGQILARSYDFSSCRTLVDIGCGSGGLAIGITRICPHLQTVVVDMPDVTPVTQSLVTEAGATDRVKVMAADIVRQPLAGRFDVAVLKAFIQVLSPDDARRALKNIGEAIAPGGVIYILGAGILDNSRISPPESALFNIVFLNLYDGGQAYTENEYRDWLADAGFEDFRRDVLADGSDVVTARKPG